MDALGDPTRRAIFERLRSGPQPVVELARGLPVSRPAVSQHLRVLKEAGLVRDQAVGTRRIYEVDAEGFGRVRTWFEDFWTDALDAFKRAAEAERSDR
jgi:DNA-binding transcriptional ArsR family regulator